ncbi:hypothetical protein H8J76_15505 [Clostridium perfringens]|nr:hypothetical protein [Clostridium perfringens]
MIKFSTDVVPLVKGNLETARFSLDGYCDGKMINGVWYLVYDRQATLNQIQEYIYMIIKTWIHLKSNNRRF